METECNRRWHNCRALLFDKDGTIINFRLMWLGWCREVVRALSAYYSAAAAERSLSVWGVDLALGRIEAEGLLAAGSTTELVESLTPRLPQGEEKEAETRRRVEEAMAEAYSAVEEKRLIRPIEGVPAVIEALHRRGYLLAVVTTDDTAKARQNMEMLNLGRYFKVVLGCDKVEKCKPAPDLALEACRLLGIEPAEAAVIGDTSADMKMGRAAGVGCCIGVASGVTTPKSLANYADIVLESAAFMTPGAAPGEVGA